MAALGAAMVLGTLACDAAAVTCDGTELLCLGLLDASEVQATAPVMVSGDFAADGFRPNDKGGIEWEFGPTVNLSRGRFEVTVTGLVPVEAGELAGGKVSIFDACGLAPHDKYGVGLQKMAPDYHEGHVFRFGMDDDNLADNWDAVIISSSDFIGCPGYSIQAWQAGESHEIVAEWGPEGMRLRIDASYDCTRGGNGDAFWAATKRFTLAARCTHYSMQQAVARFRDFKLYALGTGTEPVSCGDGHCDPGETCATCPSECGPCADGGADAGPGGTGGGGGGAAGSGTGAVVGGGAGGLGGVDVGGQGGASGGHDVSDLNGDCGCRVPPRSSGRAASPWIAALVLGLARRRRTR